ncbi:hypothetical protein NVP1083O_09 [Vibrio phage 1.083.O._10N.286.52.B9]|nr:hypothetical protein NVP1083O_09 [Vibrio phage 1.083.O._10N.286.52.B9]
MKTVKIKYNASVLVGAGWRSICVNAIGTLSKSGKMVQVIEVCEIDGEIVGGYKSRTGANRQKYNSDYIAKREVGINKRVNSLIDISGV